MGAALEVEVPTAFSVDADSVPPEVFGLSAYASPISPVSRVSRREAQQVPAVKRSRDLIAGSLGTLPLVTVKPDLSVDRTSWLTQPERDVPRSVTMTRLVEDLFYEGTAWWKITRFDWAGFPAEVVRLDPRSVDVLKDGRVHVTGDGHRGMADEWPADTDLIRFDSPNDPLLIAGARAIRQCLILDAAAQRYADGAPPLDYFTPADGVDPGTTEEITSILDAWHSARQARATGYVPAALQYNLGGFNPEQLELAEQRQHAVLEIARVAGVDAEELGVSTTSRTYANQFDRRKAFLDFTLGGYRAAIEDRLSMGDVTPRGTTIRFDLDGFLRSDAKSRWEAAEVGIRVGAITPEEVRQGEGRPAITAAAPAVPAQEEPMPEPTPIAASFDATATTMDAAPPVGTVFAVDVEERTIRGLAVPYGVVGRKAGKLFAFSQGTVKFDDVSSVKLWVGHDKSTAVGRAIELNDTEAGLEAAFKVARGPEGDRALSMAEDGVWDGLSLGPSEGAKYVLRDGVYHALDIPIHEISLTPAPVFGGARVSSVAFDAEQENPMETENTPTEVPADFSALTTALSEAITTGFANLAVPQQRESVSAGRPTEITEELPYRFDGVPGAHSLIEDMRSAQNGDSVARQRFETFVGEAFAVTTTNAGSLNPTKNRPELYVPNLSYSRPLWDSISTGTIEDKTPFTIPKFSSASGLVSTHTEGTEPTPGSFAATSQTVTPTAVSGKIEINREVLDAGGSPQADGIMWGEMLNAWYEALEARVATALAAVGTAELNLASATDSALVDALTGYFAGLQFVRGGNRYTGLVLDGQLFPALVDAADTTGRKLLPVLGATNAQGESSGAFDRVQIGNQTGRAAWALGSTTASKSYSFVPSSVWGWASTPKRFTFEYQVKSVDMAIWGYGAAAVLRDSDVKPIDYTTSDV
ncbi:phage portal protein [Nocardioides sp.]|uniref:phage portal protein n=1 Tax=Nocardioides sp. TaxID=35761 RepID=UPI002B2745A3|nr:phage portal protein [Nocardioides sp.]